MGITAARPDAIVVAKGNCGIPQYHDGHIHYTGTPELMADYARIALDAGATHHRRLLWHVARASWLRCGNRSKAIPRAPSPRLPMSRKNWARYLNSPRVSIPAAVQRAGNAQELARRERRTKLKFLLLHRLPFSPGENDDEDIENRNHQQQWRVGVKIPVHLIDGEKAKGCHANGEGPKLFAP